MIKLLGLTHMLINAADSIADSCPAKLERVLVLVFNKVLPILRGY